MFSMVDRVDYRQLEYLTSSPNPEIARISMMIKHLRDRVQSSEKGQTELSDKINLLLNESQSRGTRDAAAFMLDATVNWS